MRQKRVMIIGASAWQIPMIKKAKELGYIVGVVDYNSNAAGIKYADYYFNISTIDMEGVCAATRQFGADGITTVATDMPMRAIAYTCEKLGLKGISQETAIIATDKIKMIEKFEENNVPHPWFLALRKNEFNDVIEKLSFPCICKPADNAASRGVVVVETIGEEISVEAFAVNGIISVLAITDKLTTGSPHFVEMGHSQPSKFSGKIKETVLEVTAKAMRAVGIENGPAHVEMMITDKGPVLIELGARLGGDFITTDLVPLSTGIDILEAVIRNACGDDVDLQSRLNKASAIRYMETDFGKIAAVLNMDRANAINGIVRVEMVKEIGDSTTEIRNSLDRIGYAIAQGDSVSDAIALCEEALRTVRVVIEEEIH